MSQKSSAPPARVPAEKLVRDIRRATRKHHSAEDKIRIVLEGLRGEESIAALCRRFGGCLAALHSGQIGRFLHAQHQPAKP
jgi:transposase